MVSGLSTTTTRKGNHMIELKPCPMCGGEGERWNNNQGRVNITGIPYVQCRKCKFNAREQEWQFLPRRSDDFRAVIGEMRELFSSRPVKPYGTIPTKIDDWASRLEASVALSEVWVVFGMRDMHVKVLGAWPNKTGAERAAKEEDVVKRLVVRTQ